MANREKYIEVLSKTAKTVKEFNEDAPIMISLECVKDILELLKEQEPIEPTTYMDGLVQRFACGKCGKHLLYANWGRDNFCSKCGRAVKWE